MAFRMYAARDSRNASAAALLASSTSSGKLREIVFIFEIDTYSLYLFKISLSTMSGLALKAGGRLYVHQHVGYPVQISTDAISHLLGDIVGRTHGDFGVDFEVQIDVILQAGLAREAF